mmetsp:Transcript_17196/g.34450  ORF Transcript_17196/g.34450 Transcript_17196/m.34450 type:complete len:465 (-) Transcript_17196:121-1515(-)|eukprot:CAMPEP_0182476996 /NCGR_PEP_ID=MMETSP1319-20130603/30180_1 /TAXON_ID=172717 /ORGANISM="Bolidomonas pacifica, Strain RCC208" /LENGTH=464 /DNA_ID=CAMNT_0024678157 /DNA_START=123 /DNA_END=1517 /DNA_ORIENTATION=-
MASRGPRPASVLIAALATLVMLVIFQVLKEGNYLAMQYTGQGALSPLILSWFPPPQMSPVPELLPLPHTPNNFIVNDVDHGLVNDLDRLFEPHRNGSVLLIGDSTMRQLMNTVVGILKAHEEFQELEALAQSQPNYVQPFTDSVYKTFVEKGATSSDVLSSVMFKCPSRKVEWSDINTYIGTTPIKFGGRCAYGENTRFYTHKGATKTPVVESYDLMFLNHGTGAGGGGIGWGTNEEQRKRWIEEIRATAADAGRPQPKLIIANSGGLHMLHVYPDRLMEEWVQDQVTAAVFKETIVLGIHQLMNLIESEGGGNLIYKTTSAICNSCFYGSRRHIIDSRTNSSVDGVECNKALEHCKSGWSSDSECDDYVKEIALGRADAPKCLETSISTEGAKRFYLLELEAIAEAKEEFGAAFPNTKLDILDTHTITESLCEPKCECEKCDGMHWPAANTLFWSIIAKGISS